MRSSIDEGADDKQQIEVKLDQSLSSFAGGDTEARPAQSVERTRGSRHKLLPSHA